MKVLIVSDTHRKNDIYFTVLEKENPDLVIHCGDAEGSEYALTAAAKCPVRIVLGNNDFFSDLPRELELELGNYKVLVTHGHYYYVSMGYENIRREARARSKNLVFFGHTHRPVVNEKEGIILVNPGSISYPRQEGRRPSYAIMEIGEDGNADFEIRYV